MVEKNDHVPGIPSAPPALPGCSNCLRTRYVIEGEGIRCTDGRDFYLEQRIHPDKNVACLITKREDTDVCDNPEYYKHLDLKFLLES